MKHEAPETQRALQLIGPDALQLNERKPVIAPGPHQILCQVEAVGLCFSDLKLLKQFSSHPRKSEVVSGIAPEVLQEMPNYVPGEAATVPGHEAVVRVRAVGPGVTEVRPGERYLVQTDYRWLRTPGSNAAFGYNFEGALQEFVLMDLRVITSPQGESMLIPASDRLSASAVALVEPWACVEDAYAVRERRRVKEAGRMLVVSEEAPPAGLLQRYFAACGRPGRVAWLAPMGPPQLGVPTTAVSGWEALQAGAFDDIVYFGSSVEAIERLFGALASGGLLNIALCSGRVLRPVAAAVGRVHYGGIRMVGTTGADPAEAMKIIPSSGEIRKGEKINVVGAGGPMGVMHVVRDLCLGVEGISLFAGDLDQERLQALSLLAAPLAAKHGANFHAYSPGRDEPAESFSYIVLLVPSVALVAKSVQQAAQNGIISIFAGIPAEVTAEIDLNAYLEKRLYFIGTSGSVLADMKAVLSRVEAGALDTNLSVGAISGMEGAVEGIRAMEQRRVPGKIVVYPSCRGLGLVTLEGLTQKFPHVAEQLSQGLWNRRAEQALLATCEAG